MQLAAGENFRFFASFLRFSFVFCSRFLRIPRCLPRIFLGGGFAPSQLSCERLSVPVDPASPASQKKNYITTSPSFSKHGGCEGSPLGKVAEKDFDHSE